jgi:hypothetical protein
MWSRIIFALWLAVPWFGTWQQRNPDKRYKRVISKIEPWQDGIRVTYDMVGARGGVTHMEWTGKFDSQDYPVQGVDYVLTNSYKLLNDHSYEIVIKVEGGVAATARVEVSPDGKTLTTVTTQKTGTTTTVFDKR